MALHMLKGLHFSPKSFLTKERATLLHDFLPWDMSRNGSSLSSSALNLLEALLSLTRAAYLLAPMQH